MKRKPPLKLFVWTDFAPDYTSGLAVAIARTEADARKQIQKQYGCGPGYPSNWGTLEIHPLTKRFAACVSGGGEFFAGAMIIGVVGSGILGMIAIILLSL